MSFSSLSSVCSSAAAFSPQLSGFRSLSVTQILTQTDLIGLSLFWEMWAYLPQLPIGVRKSKWDGKVEGIEDLAKEEKNRGEKAESPDSTPAAQRGSCVPGGTQ